MLHSFGFWYQNLTRRVTSQMTSSPAQDVLARLLCQRQICDGPITNKKVRLPREALVLGTCNPDPYRDSVFRLAKDAAHIKLALPLPVASGLKWVKASVQKPTQGRELDNPDLTHALTNRTEFTQPEWKAFGIKYLLTDDYIKAGDFYFKPAAEESSRAKSQHDYMDFVKCQLKETRRGPGLKGELLDTSLALIQVSWSCFQESTPKIGTTSLRDAVRCATLAHVLDTQFCIDSEGARSSSIFDVLDEPDGGWSVPDAKLRCLCIACYLCFGMRMI